MTTTDTDPVAALAARMDALIASLGRIGLVLPPEAAPLAAGDLPPHVAAGELITSAWGNAVVDELGRRRQEMWHAYTHPGGTTTSLGNYDNGVTSLGPYSYPTRTIVTASCWGGFNGTAGVAVAFDAARLKDGLGDRASGLLFAPAGYFVSAPMFWGWDTPAGLDAGFKTRTNIQGVQTPGGTIYYSAHGLYMVQRTDI